MIRTSTAKKIPKFRGASAFSYRSLWGPRAIRWMGKARPRFFRSTDGMVLAVGVRTNKDGWFSTIILHSDKKKPFSFAAKCNYFPEKEDLLLSDANSIAKGKGIGFFRFFLNDAIAVAKKEGCSNIMLLAANQKLVEYYEKFGFKFKGLEGKRKV
ncbi:MAG: GNAT family N-acetyltransferase [archaeon]|jgi:GNAT superfamily N-acetyltransferase